MAKKRRKDLENAKTTFDEENQKEKERLMLSHQWELERRLRETKVLCDLEKLRKQAKINEMNSFRDILDIQCVRRGYNIFITCDNFVIHIMI